MTLLDDLVRDTTEICQVPAPTGEEEERAGLLCRMLGAAGVATTIDEAGNVLGELPGDPGLPTLVCAAHLDTVFPGREPVKVERRRGWLHGAGIGDNSAGVAALVSLGRRLPRSGVGRILLVGTVGEEGNGNLRGVRHLFASRGSEIDVLIAVEGAMGGRVVTGAVGAERLRVIVRGPGGHSWSDAGTPSAISTAAAFVTSLSDLPLPEVVKTTLNVGTFNGGNSVNSIAAQATLDLDLRSLDPDALKLLETRVRDLAAETFPDAGPVFVEIVRIGSRPAGRITPSHPLLGHVRSARAELELPPAEEVCSSTDANLPLSLGVPATCLGIGWGEDAHKVTERLKVKGLAPGFLALLDTVKRVAVDPGLLRRPATRE